MKSAALALFLCAACSVSAAPEGAQRVFYTASFAPGSGQKALEQVIEAYRTRLGDTEVRIRTDVAASTITAEFAFSVAFHETKTGGTLAEPLAADPKATSFVTEGDVPVRGLAHVGEEWLRYDAQGGERGLFGTQVGAHAAGAKLRIYEDDRVRTLLGTHGELEFLVAPKTTPDAEGPAGSERIRRRSRSTGEYVLLERPTEARFRFGNADIAKVGISSDEMGYPAISFELAGSRQGDFSDWTKTLFGKGLAIVLDEEILTLAAVRSRLPGKGIIQGTPGFSPGEVEALVKLLQLPRLPLPPLAIRVEYLR